MTGVVPVLSVLATAASAAAQVASAQQQAGAQRIQAGQARVAAQAAEIAARGEEVKGQSLALDTRQQLLRTLAAQNARWSAAGVALGAGTPEDIADATSAEAARQLGIIGTNARISAAGKRLGGAGSLLNAELLDDQADAASTAGWLGGGIHLAQGGMNLFDRLEGGTVRKVRPESRTGRIAGPI